MSFVFIDHASNGRSGTYINQFIKVLSTYNCKFIVDKKCNINKDDDAILKFFGLFGYTNILCKFINLHLGLFLSLIYCVFRKYKSQTKFSVVINLYQSFKVFYFFIRFLKFLNINVFLVVHDAVEFEHSYPNIIMSNRNLILKCVDNIIVFNDYTENVIKRLMLKDFIFHRFIFPIFNDCDNFYVPELDLNHIKITFIGNNRSEKGLSKLLKLWKKFNFKNIHLYVVGNGVSESVDDINYFKNLTIKDEFLSDNDYDYYLKNSNFIILPYIGGSNSGVFADAYSSGIPSLTSRIELFKNSYFYNENFAFESEDDLYNILVYINNISFDNYRDECINLKAKVKKLRVDFNDTLLSFYHENS